MRAVIYLRCSTDKQTEESQLQPCLDYCVEHGYDVKEIYRDRARSAYRNVFRSEYQKVIKHVKRGGIDHVIVWSLDRWCRRGARELRDTIEYLNIHNVQIHSIQEQWLEMLNIPGGMGEIVRDFLYSIVGWIAQNESKLKSERILDSKKYNLAKKKGLVGRPKIPDNIIHHVKKELQRGCSYRDIQKNVTYKIKYGKVKHVSLATISKIANGSIS